VGLTEVGVGQPSNLGFDPEYAKKEMAASAYPDCANFPDVTIMTYMGASDWANFLISGASTYLGCDKAKFNIEEIDFTSLLRTIKRDVPTSQRPNMFTLGWGADYPDAHNWMHDVLSCNADNPFRRPCNDIDKQIDAAARESSPDARNQMYHDIEAAFFSTEGEFPIAPLYVNVDILLYKPWAKGFFQTDGLFGGQHWDSIQIDQTAQLAARGKG
jgi:oligopeptide transport system substrate-binding protein